MSEKRNYRFSVEGREQLEISRRKYPRRTPAKYFYVSQSVKVDQERDIYEN